jgi:glutamate racemase
MKAGIFDSGIGGLTVVKSLLEYKIFEEIVYYGDTARVPYGTKDKDTIVRYSIEALEYFENQNIDILIIACNSVSAYALEELQKTASIPVVGVIDSGVLALISKVKNKNSNILVIGTNATINSNLYQKGLEKHNFLNIKSIATPLFVSLVEEGIFEGKILDASMEYYFHKLDKIDAIILGCTHFPLLEKQIKHYFNRVITIHSGDAIVQFLKSQYNCVKQYKKTKISFFASSNPTGLENVASKWLKNLI